MATILPFKPLKPPARRCLQARDGSAAIIIFPGVRYERAADVGPRKKAPREGRRNGKLNKKR